MHTLIELVSHLPAPSTSVVDAAWLLAAAAVVTVLLRGQGR